MAQIQSINRSRNEQTWKIQKRPWNIMLQNIEGLVTENSKIKIDHLREYVKEEEFLLMNFVETWLNDTVKEDADIEGYRLFRADRKGRIS